MGQPAARLGDEVAHSNAMMGLLIGAALGAALAVAVVATGGLAAVAAGALIAGGVAGGALAGEYVGAASMGPPTGAIMIGSPNVFVNGRPAAMTNIAMALCAKEYGVPQPIAMGCATVFINGMPAARKTDKLVCSAQIIQGSGDVFYDDKTVQTLEIEPEVPEWLNTTLQVVVIAAAVVGFGAAIAAVGFGAACAGLAGGLAGGWLGEKGGRALGEALGLSESATRALEVGGGFVGGLAGGGLASKAYEGFGRNPEGVMTPNSEEVCTNGCPISMHTGEELLGLRDFTWQGPLALVWRRFYRSAQSPVDLQLGHGWITPLDEWVEVEADGTLTFFDGEARRITLPLPDVGGHAVNATEHLRVERTPQHLRIRAEHGPDRLFAAGAGRRPLSAWRQGGHQVDLVRDGEGRVALLRASWGKALLVVREGHRIAALVPARLAPQGWQASGAPLMRYAYDAEGDLVAVADRLDQGESYAYESHLIARRTLPTGFSFRFAWDGPGPGARCVRNWGDEGIYDYRFEWQPEHGFSRAIDSRGGRTDYVYDADGRLRRITSPENVTDVFRYDERSLVVECAGPFGPTETREYDDEGRPVRIVDAEGHARTFAYDARGRLAARTDALGQVTAWQYDDEGRLVRLTDAAGGVTSWAYNAQGLLAQVTNAVGQVRLLWWDAEARLVADIGYDGVRRYYGYDADDRVASVSAQERATQCYEWDAVGRLAAFTDAGGRTASLRRNAAGRVTHWIAGDGAVTEFRYREGLSQPSERIDALGRVMRYEYDTERHLTALVNPKGERYELEHDLDGRLVRQVGFDGRERRYRYDPGGRLVARAEPAADGQGWALTGFERDRRGRLVATTLPDGVTNTFAWDALGRLVEANTPGHALAFAYDALGCVVEEHQGDAVLAHERDIAGRRLATTLPGGQVVAYAWNRFGRIDEITLDGRRLSAHRWDEFAREAEREQGELSTRFDYDPAGRIAAQTVAREDGERVIAREYRRDACGRIELLADLRQGDVRYVYDPAGQLVATHGATMEQFVHDPAGNLLAEGDAQAVGDRLLMQGDRHFTYDLAGNLVEERRGTGGRLVTRYAYDGANRLVAATTPRGTTTYRYDALGRRVAKASGAVETRFFWDAQTLLGEVGADDAGPRERWYLSEPGSFRPLACVERRPQARLHLATNDGERVEAPVTAVYHYHLDHLGTPREMTDSRGRIVWSARYRAFGALALADVDEVDNPLRFQGQYHDAETGLHYNLHRYYDPTTGRYLTQDPIALDGGDNLYRYVPDPVQWIDPWGLACGEDGEATGPLRGPDGRFASNGEDPPVYNRKSQYPSGYRAGTVDEVLDANTITEGPDAGKVMTADNDIVARDDPRLTIEHNTPVVDHWNEVGYDSPRSARNDFYNDTDNMSLRLRSANSSDGGLMSAKGIRYKQEVGPNYGK